MAIPVKGCLQFTLKLVNISIGFLGILAILYGVWMVRVWQEEMGTHKLFVPWFVHALLGVGIFMCAVTFIGHVAADTANAQCLSFYVVTMFLLLLLETAFMAHIVLHSDWKKEFPEDPTGGLNDFKDILNSNFKTGKWIAPLVFLAQGCSILLATVLRTLKTDRRSYDGDGDDAAPTLPFLNYPAPVIPYAVGDFPIASKNDAWKYRLDII